MKQLLLQYAQYNQWANKKMIDAMLKLGEGGVDQEIVSSFSTIRATVYHSWSAEYIWLQRLQLAEHPVWIEAEFNGTFEQACTEWQKASAQLINFVEKQYDDKAFEHVCLYHDRKNAPHKTAVSAILMHIFNHATYHRGQLVTMLRQAGAKEIPGTDFILFARK